jgi:hypothetical protein
MKRLLLNLAVGISLLLFLGTLFLWARSQSRRDGIWYNTATARYSVHSFHGRIWFWRLTGGRVASDHYVWATPAKLHPGFVWDSTPDSYYERIGKRPKGQPASMTAEQYILAAPSVGYSPKDPHAADWQALGFRYLRNNGWMPIAQMIGRYPYAQSTALFIPHWALAVLFGLLCAAGLIPILRRWHRRRHGLCLNCGYDLRGTPDRCPECGATNTTVPATP